MATLAKVLLTCDVCGNTKDVQTQTFGLDGRTYKIDLCPKDSKGLSKVAAGYVPKARKVTARQGQRHNRGRPRARADTTAVRDAARATGMKRPGRSHITGSCQQETKTSRPQQQTAKASGAKPKTAGPKNRATVSPRQPQKAQATSKQSATPTSARQEKVIYVYGILPADIEIAGETPGVGEDPGLLRLVRSDDLAALVSEVDLAGRLGSASDRRIHRDILDATATEVPVVPLRYETVLASEDAVAKELLAAHHDEFADALAQLEGRAQFLVKGRYIEEAALGEVLAQNKQARRLREQIQGMDPDAARDARTELSEIINEAVAAQRKQDAQALQHAVERVCVDSVVRQPTHELEAVHIAFLVATDQESEVDQVIEDLAQAWEGRIELQLLGPMAAYDFAGTVKPED